MTALPSPHEGVELRMYRHDRVRTTNQDKAERVRVYRDGKHIGSIYRRRSVGWANYSRSLGWQSLAEAVDAVLAAADEGRWL
ncbi:MAG: hypothetical protein QM804_10195 [Propionicimonas sp.]